MDRHDFGVFEKFSAAPDNAEDFERWVRQEDVLPFLDLEIRDDEIMLYASTDHFFVNSVLVPKFQIRPNVVTDLMAWNFNATGSWGIATCGDDVSVCEPLASTGSKRISKGEKLLFLREFEGNDNGSTYVELSQRMAHILCLHHIPERKGWCDIDQRGDIQSVVAIHEIPAVKGSGRLVSIKRSYMEKYAGLTEQVVLRMFDVTRLKSDNFMGWGETSRQCRVELGNCFADFLEQKVGSYLRGIQIADIGLSKTALLKSVQSWGSEESEHATFIAHNWRHNRVEELSCSPKDLASYFSAESFPDAPFELSPAFFNPEVLTIYKADPDKYKINSHSISCRSTWYLESWGVNDAGQVFAYLGYLNRLPYHEQLHWKKYNEAPRAGLPEGTIKTDFLGSWDSTPDPLRELVERCRKLDDENKYWWQVRDKSLFDRVHYPLTDSRAEWANELLNLDQLLVESFEEKRIRARAIELNAKVDDRMRALKLIESSLIADGFESDHAREIMSPLHEVHNLRSELKGHASDKTAKTRESEARKRCGTLVNHFRNICRSCNESLELVSKTLGSKPHRSPQT